MQECVHVLLIWAYESIIGLGEKYGNKKAGDEVPLLSWSGSRKQFRFDDFILDEKKAYENKVCVRYFVAQLDGNIYPKWDDEVEDEALKIMVNDIINNCVDEKAWDIIETSITKTKKRKDSVHQSDDDFDGSGGAENSMKMTKKKKKSGGDGRDKDPLTMSTSGVEPISR